MKPDHQSVRTILPHRYPILLVDRVLECVAGERIVAVKNVTRSEPGTLDGRAAHYPRALVIESFLQAGGLLVGETWGLDRGNADSAILFIGMQGLQWFADVPLGCQIRHTAAIDTLFESAAVYHGDIHVGETHIATIEQVTIAVRPVGAMAESTP